MNKFKSTAIIVLVSLGLNLALPMVSVAKKAWYEFYYQAEKSMSRGDWEEALNDLEQAIDGRAKPNKKARTYGMRFIRYFPYYAVGVVHYNLQNWEEAIRAFETSQGKKEIKKWKEGHHQLLIFKAAAASELGASEADEQIEQLISQFKKDEQKPELVDKEKERQKTIKSGLEASRNLITKAAYQDALVRLNHIIAIEPQNSEAKTLLEETNQKIYQQEQERQRQEELETAYNTGIQQFNQREYEGALTQFKRVVELQPNHRDAQTFIQKTNEEISALTIERQRQEEIRSGLAEGQRLFNAKQYNEAKSYFDKVLLADKENPEAEQLLQATVQAINNERKLAEERKRQAQIENLLQQGRTHITNEAFEKAIAVFGQLLELDANHTEAQALLTQANKGYQKQQDAERLKREIQQSLTEGIRLFDEKDFEAAITQFNHVLALDENNSEAKGALEKANQKIYQQEQAHLQRQELETMYSEAIQQFNRGEYEQALTQFKQVAKVEPDYQEAQSYIQQTNERIAAIAIERQRQEEIRTNLVEGKRLYDVKQYSQAKQYFAEALRIDPDNPEATQLLQMTNQAIEKEQKLAEERARRAQIENLRQQGKTHIANEEFEEAIGVFGQLLELDANHTEAQVLLTQATEGYQKQQEAERLKREIQQSLTEGIRLFDDGDFEAAITKFNYVLALDEENSEAKSYLENAQKERAKVSANNLMASKVKEVLELGKTLFADGQFDDAKLQFSLALLIDDTNAEAKEHLRRCEVEIERRAKREQEENIPIVIAIGTPLEKEITVIRSAITVTGTVIGKNVTIRFLRNGDDIIADDTRGFEGVRKRATSRSLKFQKTIPLKPGLNQIEIIAEDINGKTATEMLKITYETDQTEIWAAVIGISKYQAAPDLKFSHNDANAFAAYLKQNMGLDDKHIFMMLNEQATLQKIRKALGTELKNRAGKDDTVIIFYAGHGAPEPEAQSPDGDGLEKYILPYDADPDDLFSTALSMNEITRIFGRIRSDRLIFISDACYSGAAGGRTLEFGRRAGITDGFLKRLSKGKGRVILTASGPNEVSTEFDRLQHGVFTYYLLEGLNGKADLDDDGYISVDEVYKYVTTKVPEATKQDQNPVRKGTVEGEIIIGRY